MQLSPGLHALHRARSAEVIAIAVLAQPAPLAGQFAGVLTFQRRTVALTIDSSGIRKKKPAAMAAFSPGWRAAHGEHNLRRIQEPRKRKRRPPRRRSPKKEEELSARSDRRKRSGRKRNFKPLVFLHFHSAAGTTSRVRCKKVTNERSGSLEKRLAPQVVPATGRKQRTAQAGYGRRACLAPKHPGLLESLPDHPLAARFHHA